MSGEKGKGRRTGYSRDAQPADFARGFLRRCVSEWIFGNC
jgi:hypothetical protein